MGRHQFYNNTAAFLSVLLHRASLIGPLKLINCDALPSENAFDAFELTDASRAQRKRLFPAGGQSEKARQPNHRFAKNCEHAALILSQFADLVG
jgi:hypothetical protein